jgi:hypothetical protein
MCIALGFPSYSIVPFCPFSPIMLSTTLLNFDITGKKNKEFPTENPAALALYFVIISVKSTYSVSCADSKFSISQFINDGAVKSLIFGHMQVFRRYLLFTTFSQFKKVRLSISRTFHS